MDNRINATQWFQIYKSRLWIPLNLIGANWSATDQALNGVALGF
jgi:hypothetical protein